MKKYSLTADARELVGRKVKSLRAAGKIPATIYGKDVKSVSVAVDATAFEKLYAQAGETGLVELSLGGTIHPVLVHTVQRDPVKRHFLHIEFHQVDLKKNVHAKVPVEFVGEADAVTQKVGVLLTILDEIEVEALPTDLPESLSLDVAKLAAVGEELKVSDIKVPQGVTILTPLDQIVVKVDSLVSKEAEAQAAADAAAAAAAAAEAAPAEGEAPAEGATPKEAEAAPAEGEAAKAPAKEEPKKE
jgi:large subunit ribosomal protein L25